MSISAIFTSIGTFLTSPIVTGAANVASIATLPVSIATKVDTKKMRNSISSMRSDINLLSSDILDLRQDITDERAEMRYNVAYTGQIPVSVNHGRVALATEYAPIVGEIAAQKQNMYATTTNQMPQQEVPAQSAQIPTPPAQPAPQAAPVQNVMVGQPDMAEMLKGMLPDIITGVVTALNQQAAPAQPETPAQPASDQKDDKKQENKNG